MALPPPQIFSAWLQGAEQAPEIVKLCFSRWAELNPGYQLKILDLQAAAAALAGIVLPPLPVEALSDVLRSKLLLDHGGIWVDATLLPVVPLDAWLPRHMENTDFFAFARPWADRPLASWFYAAAPNHPITKRWWQEILRFWAAPRRLANYPGQPYTLIPPDPVASVAPHGPGDVYPYFWSHYLFQYLLETDAGFAALWSACPQIPAAPPHKLQDLCAGPGPITPKTFLAAARAAPVQKLNWRANYPMEMFAAL